MICHNNSFSVEDWGLRFLNDNKVILFSLNKPMYEIFQHERRYRTDSRNILIFKNKDVEYIINRTRLKLGNKQCKLVKGDPLILLQERIEALKLNKRKGNRL
jgi:O-glycosyl hydrolase